MIDWPQQLLANTSFSTKLAGLQLAIDSTSLGEYKTCPRRYFYSIICGWQPKAESPHLAFGILLHSAREQYYHARRAKPHEEALSLALTWVLKATWDRQRRRPWASDHPTKNRLTLVRTLVWYLDQFGENDSLETVLLHDGSPAVELSFRFQSGFASASSGEQIMLCGHLDRVVKFNGEPFGSDLKSTQHGLDAGYFAQFTPDNQMSLYTLAGQVALAQPLRGIIIDAAQVLVGGTRFQRGMVERTRDQLVEWLQDTGQWLGKMEASAAEGRWEMNDKACHQYGGCPFRPVCSRDPGARDRWLAADYRQRVWDPLLRRGDI